jgi:hypothetical protein
LFSARSDICVQVHSFIVRAIAIYHLIIFAMDGKAVFATFAIDIPIVIVTPILTTPAQVRAPFYLMPSD